MTSLVKPLGATVCSAAGCSASVRDSVYRYCDAHVPSHAQEIVSLYGQPTLRDVSKGGRNAPFSQDIRIMELIREGYKTRASLLRMLPHVPTTTLKDAIYRLKAKGAIHTVRNSYYEFGPEPKCQKPNAARPAKRRSSART
jgi:hypothetical protein